MGVAEVRERGRREEVKFPCTAEALFRVVERSKKKGRERGAFDEL